MDILHIHMAHLALGIDAPAGDGVEVFHGERQNIGRAARRSAVGDDRVTRRLHVAGRCVPVRAEHDEVRALALGERGDALAGRAADHDVAADRLAEERIAAMIGFDETRANTLVLDLDGTFAGEVVEPIFGRDDKLATLIDDVPLWAAAATQRGPRTVAMLKSRTSQKPISLRSC